jgi:hypothetical protein
VLTTNTDLPAAEVALKYKQLWMVEDAFYAMWANQNLSIAWNNLDTEEACVCLQILESSAHRSRKELEIFALTKTVLARGFTLEAAQSLEVRADRPSNVEHPTLLLSVREQNRAEWLLPAVPIPYHQEHGHYS